MPISYFPALGYPMPVETQLIAQVVGESIEDLCRATREPNAQDLLAYKLRSGSRVEVGKLVRKEGLPDVEVESSSITGSLSK